MAQQKKPTAPKAQEQSNSALIKLNAKIQKLIDNPDSRVKAIASVNIGGEYAIHGIKIIDSDKGRFVSMPNEKWTDANGNTKYKDTFHAVSAEARENLVNSVISAYEQKLSENPSQSEVSDDELPDPTQKM